MPQEWFFLKLNRFFAYSQKQYDYKTGFKNYFLGPFLSQKFQNQLEILLKLAWFLK